MELIKISFLVLVVIARVLVVVCLVQCVPPVRVELVDGFGVECARHLPLVGIRHEDLAGMSHRAQIHGHWRLLLNDDLVDDVVAGVSAGGVKGLRCLG